MIEAALILFVIAPMFYRLARGRNAFRLIALAAVVFLSVKHLLIVGYFTAFVLLDRWNLAANEPDKFMSGRLVVKLGMVGGVLGVYGLYRYLERTTEKAVYLIPPPPPEFTGKN
jgi:hypothetical protein